VPCEVRQVYADLAGDFIEREDPGVRNVASFDAPERFDRDARSVRNLLSASLRRCSMGGKGFA
jgi:hypothetical protein